MLVVRRRAGESLLIGADIEVQILEITPTRVKLGIVAPSSVTVLRKEIVLTREQNQAAAAAATLDRLRGLVTDLNRAR